MTAKLNYLATKTLAELSTGILENIERYRNGDFLDMVDRGGWNMKLSIEVDLDELANLDNSRTHEAEVNNSLVVWRALHDMTPALACEERVWVRLSHVECLEYSRARWLSLQDDYVVTEKEVGKHFFARGLTGYRDDHSISRLWWNAKIAKDLRPNDQKGALKLLLKKADIRKSLVERPWTVSRKKIATAILRLMDREVWVTDHEDNFRIFIKIVNRLGGGVVFELKPEEEMDRFMDDCCSMAQKPV